MIRKYRFFFAKKFRAILDQGFARKKAFLAVKLAIKDMDKDLPFSKRSLYRWCEEAGVSTR